MSNTRLIFGFHAITSRLRQNPASVNEIFLDAGRRDQRARDLAKLAETQDVRLIPCDDARLAGMAGGARHQGVAACIDASRSYIDIEDVLDTLVEPALLLVLDGIQDPHNLGACLRVADAFGVHAVVAPKDRAVGLTATVHKVASGAVDAVPYISVTNLARTLRELKQRGVSILGATADADSNLNAAILDGPIAWVLGAEGKGMRRLTRETCDQLVSIPMLGSVESLNVSVSAGICLFETRRQRSAKEP
ncbi:23S rRNA (guanosine(2251)-2'-O)-methyltransferase RlmB [Nitrosospira briensis]|uniref:23S rRNA (guanosine(2251)-2'-O)-methyltransferase RlmB n=1 Tax=Nitrosospira briensis TaxID=35799 RepID=UPI0008E8E27A|nr:23S rRNA (guanosine(2251)-2'-O)-methyltransferase RlmB [Nitrosospira briensis]SFO19813.1 23S rRNA Gm-2251 2'-O-methyltransferase [Nitrosospira briensis]